MLLKKQMQNYNKFTKPNSTFFLSLQPIFGERHLIWRVRETGAIPVQYPLL